MEKKTDYVVGFLFSEDRENITLIKKTKPEWQKGKFNGVGGKIENGEQPIDAMIREFAEEAGSEILSWTCFAIISGNNYTVHFFKAFENIVTETMEDEEIHTFPVRLLRSLNVIPNLHWLIPMALDGYVYADVYDAYESKFKITTP